MDNYQELMQVAQALRTVKVDGEFWVLMQACVNSITKVAESLRSDGNAINDNT